MDKLNQLNDRSKQMFRNFWSVLFGKEIAKPNVIEFSKDHTLTERAINVLRSAGVLEDSNWPGMVDKVRAALAAYAQLDELILPPLNVPTSSNLIKSKTIKRKNTIKKVPSENLITEPTTIEPKEPVKAESKKGSKLSKTRTIKGSSTSKIAVKSTQKLNEKSVDQISN